MKSMKKMLCLLLVAMLLVAAIPVGASATGEVGATEVTYSVVFQVKKGSGDFKDSLPVAYFTISSSASNEEVRAAAQAAVVAAGISSVDANTIVSKVAARGQEYANYVYNIVYGNIETYPTASEYYFILNATDRPLETVTEYDGDGYIYLDAEGNGRFVDTQKSVKVKMLKKEYNGTTTYTLATNGGASVDKIRSALGADYKNANLSVTSSGPSTDSSMIYYVTVLGTNGTTGTNVPVIDGSTGGSSTNNGGSSSNNGGSGSNNGGSSTNNGGTSQDLGNGGTGIVNGSNTDRNRFPYDVVLHIYQNNKVDEPVKNIVINDSLAADGTVSLSEVKTEVMKYFSAKTSAGIGYAGLYYARGNWVKDYATYNGEYDSITGIDSMRQVSQVDINVMITNATAKTTSTAKADSSNPKTGDTIFVPVMVMGLTATALAAAYVFGKKRIAR